MSTLTALRPKTTASEAMARARGWLSPLNLHWAGVAALALVNLYLLAHMAFLWQEASSHNADALTEQGIALKAAEAAAQPLRGLDAKLEQSTKAADEFYKQRLPGSNSEVYAEVGALAKKQNVRFTRAQYVYAPVLPDTPAQLTEMRIDASLSGDYRPLVQFINSLERDKMFFVVNGVTFTGQDSGTVNLRLRLTTYLRGGVEVLPGGNGAATETAAITAGGPAR
jgi:hypothetical protein